MGLDMRPLGKPKPGFEIRFEQLFRIIGGTEKQEISFWDKVKGKRALTKDELLQEWFGMQIEAYETIKAPRVGRDSEADVWAREKYLASDKKMSEEDFLREAQGYYVIELAKETDGVPMYIAMGQDRNVFRGQFMQDCVELIGEDLVNEAWETKLARQTLDYGNRLLSVANKIAKEKNLEYLRDQRQPPDTDQTTIESKLHIVYSLARWLIFYGKNGHGYEADF